MGCPVVIVDLGNVHDCLKNLLPLAESGLVEVIAYADMEFNGFGVKPDANGKHCVVKRATTPDKNAADVEIVWDIAQRCGRTSVETPLCFVVVTRDHGFRSLEGLVMRTGHALNFASDWPTLQEKLALLCVDRTDSHASPP